jgi:hypothetical protein
MGRRGDTKVFRVGLGSMLDQRFVWNHDSTLAWEDRPSWCVSANYCDRTQSISRAPGNGNFKHPNH